MSSSPLLNSYPSTIVQILVPILLNDDMQYCGWPCLYSTARRHSYMAACTVDICTSVVAAGAQNDLIWSAATCIALNELIDTIRARCLVELLLALQCICTVSRTS